MLAKKERFGAAAVRTKWASLERKFTGVEERLMEQLILQDREMYALELVDYTDGEVKLGSVYVTLERMEAKGYVASRLEDKDPKKPGQPLRFYRTTLLGRSKWHAQDGEAR